MQDTQDDYGPSRSIPSICENCRFLAHASYPSFVRPGFLDGLLSSNSLVPSDQEEELRLSRAAASLRLADLNQHIKRLHLDLQQLQEEKDHVEHILDDLRVVFHPVKRLPTEILRRVFLLNQGATSQKEPPWHLAQVSGHWRQVAIGYSELWSNIRMDRTYFTKIVGISLLPKDSNDMQPSASLLRHQLERSGSFPLNITLQPQCTLREGNLLLDTLMASSDRWKKLDLCMDLDSWKALAPIRERLSSLEVLALCTTTAQSPDDIQLSILHDLFESAPRLHSISDDPDILPFCRFPWQQIMTYCEDRDLNCAPHYISQLSNMTSLRFCQVGCNKMDIVTYGAPSQITLAHLEELCVGGESRYMLSLLRRLITPRLRRLIVDSDSTISVDQRLDIEGILHRLPMLMHLEVMRRKFYDFQGYLRVTDLFSHWEGFGSLSPDLRSLFLGRGIDLTEEFLYLFISSNSSPSLAAIYIQEPGDDIDEGALVRLATSRPGLAIHFSAVYEDYYRANNDFVLRY